MVLEETGYSGRWEVDLSFDRARLVRLCAYLAGDADVAEDLAQETLLEAWRHADKLHDVTGRARWLAAIARNVCLRWGRRRGRDLSRRVDKSLRDDVGAIGEEEWPDDGDSWRPSWSATSWRRFWIVPWLSCRRSHAGC